MSLVILIKCHTVIILRIFLTVMPRLGHCRIHVLPTVHISLKAEKDVWRRGDKEGVKRKIETSREKGIDTDVS